MALRRTETPTTKLRERAVSIKDWNSYTEGSKGLFLQITSRKTETPNNKSLKRIVLASGVKEDWNPYTEGSGVCSRERGQGGLKRLHQRFVRFFLSSRVAKAEIPSPKVREIFSCKCYQRGLKDSRGLFSWGCRGRLKRLQQKFERFFLARGVEEDWNS